jgi:hypothetical protein
MIGNVTKFKYPIESEIVQKAYDVIQLTEPHEAGEIIDDCWLIINSEFNEFKGKYETGYYVKVVNIKFCDIIETDINYDNRSDLRKINIKSMNIYPISNQPRTFKINVYEVN